MSPLIASIDHFDLLSYVTKSPNLLDNIKKLSLICAFCVVWLNQNEKNLHGVPLHPHIWTLSGMFQWHLWLHLLWWTVPLWQCLSEQWSTLWLRRSEYNMGLALWKILLRSSLSLHQDPDRGKMFIRRGAQLVLYCTL